MLLPISASLLPNSFGAGGNLNLNALPCNAKVAKNSRGLKPFQVAAGAKVVLTSVTGKPGLTSKDDEKKNLRTISFHSTYCLRYSAHLGPTEDSAGGKSSKTS